MTYKRNNSKGRKKLEDTDVESLDMDDIEDEGFFEGDVDFGTPLMSFSFGGDNVMESKEVNTQSTTLAFSSNDSAVPANQNTTAPPKGLTPPIDGEYFTVKRCYQYRPSTIRELNELKANHADITAYLNTILDEAILFYYDHVMSMKQRN